MSERTTTKKYIQGIAFFLFIVGLPMGSWYYLQAGFDYHKELMSELHNYGRIPDFKMVDQDGDTITRSDIEGKVMVVNFFNPRKDSYTSTTEYMQKMYGQFHDRHDFVFVSYALNNTNSSQLKRIAQEAKLDNDQSIFLSGTTDQLNEILRKGYKIPDLGKRDEEKKIPLKDDFQSIPNDYPYFILVDESGTIRNYYKVDDESSVTKLVEHIAIILPRKAEEKAELIRETEK